MTILKDEEGNEWEQVGVLSGSNRIFRKLPKKRVPFGRVDKFMDSKGLGEMWYPLVRLIVEEALAQMEERSRSS